MKTYSLIGRVIDVDKKSMSGTHVLAFDEGFLHPGDFLGEATTDSNGLFKITFDESKFKKTWEILGAKPDVSIIVKDSSGKQVLKTKVMKTDKEIEYHVKVSDNKPDPNSEDIYSDNFRRILATLSEVGANIGLENRINLGMLQNKNLQKEVRTLLQDYTDSHEDRQNNFQNLMAAISGLVNATVEEDHLGRIGYDGPQVPRIPRRMDYLQVIMWPRKEGFRWA